MDQKEKKSIVKDTNQLSLLRKTNIKGKEMTKDEFYITFIFILSKIFGCIKLNYKVLLAYNQRPPFIGWSKH